MFKIIGTILIVLMAAASCFAKDDPYSVAFVTNSMNRGVGSDCENAMKKTMNKYSKTVYVDAEDYHFMRIETMIMPLVVGDVMTGYISTVVSSMSYYQLGYFSKKLPELREYLVDKSNPRPYLRPLIFVYTSGGDDSLVENCGEAAESIYKMQIKSFDDARKKAKE